MQYALLRPRDNRGNHGAILWPGRLALILGLAACRENTGLHITCFMDDCLGAAPLTPVPVIAGFPSAKVVNGVGQLVAGDSVILSVVMTPIGLPSCNVADTVRTPFIYVPTDNSVAEIRPIDSGRAVLRALTPGTFRLTPKKDAYSASAFIMSAAVCPSGQGVDQFLVINP